ncbi:MAG: FAD-dependent oxidoreductase [Thermodesulfobacteriota bacterium]|nr:FAD-dependent oxidoreductase [Thermodesulfobacteriota bacterium]
MAEFAKLFEPGRIGKMLVRNRIVMAAMGTHSVDFDSQMNDRTIHYYGARAKGGAGLIITQGVEYLPGARIPHMLSIDDDMFIPRLTQLVTLVHKHGAKIACQISHTGTKIQAHQEALEKPKEAGILGPSAVHCVTFGVLPRAMTREEVRDHVEKWSDGAHRAKRAGFDAIEIHGAHGYFLGAFLSGYQNRRTDEYGGSLKNRARFACEVISRTRQKVGPDFPILFRFNGCDFIAGGITVEEAVLMAPLFVEAGADVLDISAANQDTRQWRDLTYLFPDAAIVYTAEAIKKVVNVPVITVGKIGDPVLADSILKEGRADFIAMGRALLADPELPNKAKEGRLEDIRRCIYCNNCRLGHGKKGLIEKKGAGLSCTVNPELLREKEFEIKLAAKPKKVMVIGGGLAGMEASRVLKERGHNVCLYEKSDKLGGLWNTAALDPSKAHFATVTDYLSRGLRKAGVPTFIKREVTPQIVYKEKPDAVVLATGATPKSLNIPGIDRGNVVQAIDFLAGKAEVGQRVVVIGGRLVGMETALMLAEQGKKVSIVTLFGLGEDGVPLERNIFVVLRERLVEHGVVIYANSPVLEIAEKGIFFAWEKELGFVPADTVVLAVGLKPENNLAEELKRMVSEFYAIGDCVDPRNALEAINEGAEIARKI